MDVKILICIIVSTIIFIVVGIAFIIDCFKNDKEKIEEEDMNNKNLVCPYGYCNECIGNNKGCCEILEEVCIDRNGNIKKVCPFFKTKEEVEQNNEKLKKIKYSAETQKLLDKVVADGRKKREEEKAKAKNKEKEE